jgi:hypothetical protein
VLAACPKQRSAVAAQARHEVRETPVAVTDLGLRESPLDARRQHDGPRAEEHVTAATRHL